MNWLAGVTVTLLTVILGDIAITLCYGLNEHALGGHLPFLLITAGPVLAYALGRLAPEV